MFTYALLTLATHFTLLFAEEVAPAILIPVEATANAAAAKASTPVGGAANEASPHARRPQSKIEVGVALLNFYLPDYPGADETSYRILPVPHFVYRGDIFRADRDGGYRGRFFNFERYEFDVSGSGAFPTSSSHSDARVGMDALDWLGEIGPRFKYHIIPKNPAMKLDFELPLRYVFSTDFRHWNQRGYTVTPELSFRHMSLLPIKGFVGASLSGVWATEKLMDYFYEVPPKFVAVERPTYNAKAGFLNWGVDIAYIRPFTNDWVMFMGVARNFYAAAENRGGPLLRDIETESYFFGVAKGIYRSDELATSSD